MMRMKVVMCLLACLATAYGAAKSSPKPSPKPSPTGSACEFNLCDTRATTADKTCTFCATVSIDPTAQGSVIDKAACSTIANEMNTNTLLPGKDNVTSKACTSSVYGISYSCESFTATSARICTPVPQPQLLLGLVYDLDASAGDVIYSVISKSSLCPAATADTAYYIGLYIDSQDADCPLQQNYTYTPTPCDTSSLPLAGANPLTLGPNPVVPSRKLQSILTTSARLSRGLKNIPYPTAPLCFTCATLYLTQYSPGTDIYALANLLVQDLSSPNSPFPLAYWTYPQQLPAYATSFTINYGGMSTTYPLRAMVCSQNYYAKTAPPPPISVTTPANNFNAMFIYNVLNQRQYFISKYNLEPSRVKAATFQYNTIYITTSPQNMAANNIAYPVGATCSCNYQSPTQCAVDGGNTFVAN